MSAFAHPDARRRKVTHHPTRLGDENRFGSRDVALHGATDHDSCTRYGADNDGARTESQIASHTDVTLDATQNLQGAIAPNVAANDRGAAYHRYVRHLVSHTSMSTLPRNDAPSAMVRRLALTSPISRPPA